jgi:hypothetical protein
VNAPAAGQLWLIRPAGKHGEVAAIRSREQAAWTVLGGEGHLDVVLAATPLRPIPGYPVPAEATWDERVALLARFSRSPVGASR